PVILRYGPSPRGAEWTGITKNAGTAKTFRPGCPSLVCNSLEIQDLRPVMHAENLRDTAMMHSDALLQRAAQGDQNAQGKLVQLWYKRIYNFSFKFFLDHDLAMDVSQNTFISMCRNLPSLHDVGKIKAWLYKIEMNYC